MKEPIYKPDTWVTYQQAEVGGFGRIIGGSFVSGIWRYTLSGVLTNGQYITIKEDEIIFTLQNGSWIAPTHMSGGGSAYTA